MVESKDDWRDIINATIDTGCDGIELNFGCPHGMCERGMGSAVGQEPEVLKIVAGWAVEYSTVPVLIKLTPNIGDILEPGVAAVEAGVHGLSLINTIKSLIGVDLDRFVPYPVVGRHSTNGGYCGPAVKPIALHGGGAGARPARGDPHLRHRRNRDVARRGRVHRARRDQRAGVHGGDALRIPDRRGP